MALESTTYIDGLVTTNPTGTDQASTADDHIRLLKASLKRTFPNIAAAVSTSAGDLNVLDGARAASVSAGTVVFLSGLQSNLQDQLDDKASSASFNALVGDQKYLQNNFSAVSDSASAKAITGFTWALDPGERYEIDGLIVVGCNHVNQYVGIVTDQNFQQLRVALNGVDNISDSANSGVWITANGDEKNVEVSSERTVFMDVRGFLQSHASITASVHISFRADSGSNVQAGSWLNFRKMRGSGVN